MSAFEDQKKMMEDWAKVGVKLRTVVVYLAQGGVKVWKLRNTS